MRFLVGDTVEADQQMQDEEIDYLVALHGSAQQAAVAAARALSARYSSRAVKSRAVDGLRIEYENRAEAFADLASSLASSSASGLVPIPVATGILVSDKLAAEDDADRVPPAIAMGMDDREPVDASQDLRLEEE